MNVIISDGSTVNIEVGNSIKIRPGFLPDWYDNVPLSVVKVETHGGINYPFVRFFHQEPDPETGELVTIQDETSAVSGDLILP